MLYETKDLTRRFGYKTDDREQFLDQVEATLARHVAASRAGHRTPSTLSRPRPRPRPLTPLRATEAKLAAVQTGTRRLVWQAAANSLSASYARLMTGAGR